MNKRTHSLLMLLATSVAAGVVQAETVRVWFVADGQPAWVQREVPDGTSPIEAAMTSLVAGPTQAERLAGYTTMLPSGTRLVDLRVDDRELTVDLSSEVLAGLTESRLRDIFEQFRLVLFDFPEMSDVALTCGGRLLRTYLDPVVSGGSPARSLQMEPATAGLAGRNITIGPSHGRYWHVDGEVWYYQRPQTCGLGEEIQEDLNSIRLMQFLYQYLAQDGVTVHVPRQLDQSDCCHPAEGLAWWRMAARYWLEHTGVPSWVWDSSTDHYSDDIYARPLYADYCGSDIYVSHHTNAFDGTASGTEVYYDATMSHPAHVTPSYNLALAIKTNIESAIRGAYDSAWPIRNGGQPRNSNGAYGEIHVPDRPACLVELAFHDNCTKDALYLVDPFFRSVSQWGHYKGICQYFGTTPTWDRYSCELVTDTIPTSMSAGESYNVSVTFRNRGVLWQEARSFRLGAADDSDPFTAFNRVTIGGDVWPGQEYTFSFTMTAPLIGGTYTTDWRMVRDGVTWFGPTLIKQVEVHGVPTVIVSEDFEPYSNHAEFEVVWPDTGSSEYQLDTGFGNGGNSLQMPSPSADNLGRHYRDLGGTFIGTDEEPLIFRYDLYLDPAGAPAWSSARHFCELRGYSGGGYGQGSLTNTVAIGVYNTSGDTYSTTKHQGRVLNDGDISTQWYTLDAEAGARDRAGGWHEMAIEVRTSQVRFLVDGILAEVVPRDYAAGFTTVVLGSDLTANGHQVHVDNVQVLTYISPPVITLHPAAQAVCPGSTAMFMVEASGAGAAYRWQKNQVDLANGDRISGADTPTLQIAGAIAGDVAQYRCVVTNSGGEVISQAAGLTLKPATTISQQPTSQEVEAGSTATFNVTASGEGTLSYQWEKDSVPLSNGDRISGADSSSLLIIDVTADDVGEYRCAVTGGCGTLMSLPASLTFPGAPGDFDDDGDVDQEDFGHFQACLSGTSQPQNDPDCQDAKLDGDNDVDQNDFASFLQCMQGPDVQVDYTCAD